MEINNTAAVEEQKKTVAVAIYTRKSGDENLVGVVTSIDAQKAACRNYIQIQKEKGWQEYQEAFDDPAFSGKDLERPAMRRLLRAVEERRVQAVIVYKLDRLTRNGRDFQDLLELFEKHNVGFVSATESLDTKSPQGRLMVSIMAQFAQYDRELDQERAKDFHLARARKGLWCGGLAPLGYDSKDKKFTVNEEGAKLVRRVFDLYLKFRSPSRVAEELSRLDFRRQTYKTKKGKLFGGQPFDEDSVSRILQQKIYVGKIVNNRTGLEFSSQYPAIIELEVFDKVQTLMEEHARHERAEYCTNKHGFLLKGLPRCGKCGSALVGYVRPKKNKVYRYYRCMANVDGTPVSCDFKSITADQLEVMVLRKLEETGLDRGLLERAVREAERHSGAKIAELEAERKDFDANLRRVRQELGTFRPFAETCGDIESIQKELVRMEAAEKELASCVAKLDTQVAGLKTAGYSLDSAQKAFRKLTLRMKGLPVHRQVGIVRTLVKRLKVWKDRVELDLNELSEADLKQCLVQIWNPAGQYMETILPLVGK
jgi:DNA invertase Pin-like site-specific DNA recombinase